MQPSLEGVLRRKEMRGAQARRSWLYGRTKEVSSLAKAERFRGRVHMPGADGEWGIELELEWQERDVSVRIDGAPGGISDWPGLAVQTFGPTDEVAFRTKGIPPLFTHWWHFVRTGNGDLWGMVIGLPDVEGRWLTCPLLLEKITE